MKLYRMTKEGYIEELVTQGTYHPPGWYTTRWKAAKAGYKETGGQ